MRRKLKKIGVPLLERKNGSMVIPEKGDIVWLDFNPQSGHEQMGRRPAIVLSNNLFNQKTGMAIVCPITNTNRGFSLHVEIIGSSKVKGFIMAEQVKSVDYSARNVEIIEKVSEEVLNELLSILYACIY